MKFEIKKAELTFKIISWLQIIGGITGLGLIAKLLVNTGAINGPVLLIFLTGLSLFIFSIYTGVKLFSNPNKRLGITLSFVNQALQLVQWNILGYGISYSSGAEMLIEFSGWSMKFSFSALISSFNMSINSDSDSFIKVNVLAIIVIILLYVIKKKMTIKESY